MFGLTLSSVMLFFGIYLKLTKDTGFANVKKFSWLFIALGIITLIGRIIIMYQKGEL